MDYIMIFIWFSYDYIMVCFTILLWFDYVLYYGFINDSINYCINDSITYFRNDSINDYIIDDIADQILTLLIPTTGVQDIGDNEFQIYATARTSSRYLTMQEGNNFINRKILIINNSIIQK